MEVNQSPAEGLEQTQAAEQTESQAPQVTEIDGLSAFKFQGEDYTPDRLLEIVKGYKDSSAKLDSFAQEQKFYENLEADIENVLKDPANLAQKFKEIYPKKFHGILDRILGNGQAPAQKATAQNALPPEIAERLKKLDELEAWKQSQEQRTYQAEVKNAEAQIDKITQPLFKQFPMADEEAVFAKAEALVSRGAQLNEKTWERLIRESHEKSTKRWDQHQGAILKKQTEIGRRGADVGPGGAAPGQAPQRPRTLDEAREAMLKHVAQS